MEQSTWLIIGEPVGDSKVEITKQTEYNTSSLKSREDDVEKGVADIDILRYIEEIEEVQNHQMDDGSINLGALPKEHRQKLLEYAEFD